MKELIQENYRKIGLGLLVFSLVLGLTFTITQTLETTDKKGNDSPSEVSEKMLPETDSNKTNVYFFWGDGCPYCAKEKPFLEKLDRNHGDLEVKMYEVYYSKENQEMYKNVAEKYGTSARGVPATFIGDEYWRGYNERIGDEIESKINECLENKCDNLIQ